ncbi:MAG: hypothetical protein A2W23_10000 [Planctomycetes bacterium RBG_16_43_13]|nr:MAG: hypothetical protein A2W23_10000 [Planctomycetes bacterium RBG_16_43_13]
MLGLNRGGEIILFNKSALELFGETLQSMVMHDVDELNFSSIDPGIPQLVKKVIGKQEKVQVNTKIGSKCISTLGIPLKSKTEFRGLLLKITVTNEK